MPLSLTAREISRATGAEPDPTLWKEAHGLFVRAFHKPENSAEQKALSKVIKAPLPEEMQKGLFEYDAFLRIVGRMSLSESRCPYPLLNISLSPR